MFLPDFYSSKRFMVVTVWVVTNGECSWLWRRVGCSPPMGQYAQTPFALPNPPPWTDGWWRLSHGLQRLCRSSSVPLQPHWRSSRQVHTIASAVWQTNASGSHRGVQPAHAAFQTGKNGTHTCQRRIKLANATPLQTHATLTGQCTALPYKSAAHGVARSRCCRSGWHWVISPRSLGTCARVTCLHWIRHGPT